MSTNKTTFPYVMGRETKEFSVIGIENPENKGQSYRVLARLIDDSDLDVIYLFYSTDKTLEELQFIRKYTY